MQVAQVAEPDSMAAQEGKQEARTGERADDQDGVRPEGGRDHPGAYGSLEGPGGHAGKQEGWHYAGQDREQGRASGQRSGPGY